MHFSFFFSPFSQVKKGCTTSNSTTKRLTESKRRSSEHHGCTKERGIHAYLRGRKKERVMVVALGLSFTKLRPSEVRSSPFFFCLFRARADAYIIIFLLPQVKRAIVRC